MQIVFLVVRREPHYFQSEEWNGVVLQKKKKIKNSIAMKEREWVIDKKEASTTVVKYSKLEITFAWHAQKEQHGLMTLVWKLKICLIF